MKYTKKTKFMKHDRKESTWEKFKDQQNRLSAKRRGASVEKNSNGRNQYVTKKS
ncbi:hypothetical protein [Fructilactobacillus florum]|uniref:Uncharacterized protein n=1 Tax=Fructilactobacillus florum DSM 22689 = JCM 16035 TaxID=1423745 RepID=A0A0R2CMG3_9LACO|nr:hypothetical protein [Fructilactobacillus florum]KRM92501.1 hypothetical protein FC87_GL000113 [Fructilactobacillus florum DSM 22689 = JCM 16035]